MPELVAEFSFPVEQGKITEFARATGAMHPDHRDGVTPATFLATMEHYFPETAPPPWAVVGLEPARLLHGAERHDLFAGPLRAGQVLRARMMAHAPRVTFGRQGNAIRIADVVTVLTDGCDEVVARRTTTLLEVERALAPAAGRPGGDGPQAVTTWDMGEVTRTAIVRYQGASGDFHPVHHDDTFARAGGHSAAISVGMLHAGQLCAQVTNTAGPDRLRSVDIRFQAIASPGDHLVGHLLDVIDGADAELHQVAALRGSAVVTTVTVGLRPRRGE